VPKQDAVSTGVYTSSSHLKILGARRVTCSKVNTEDPRFWIDLSTSALSGAFCSVHVNLLYYVCIAVLTLDAGLLARRQYPEGPAISHLDTGFSWFPCVYKQMLRWFPRLQVATTCLSCSPPDLNSLVSFFFSIFVYM